MVVRDEKPVIAQYGQWDHYPDGQGATALAFVSDEDNLVRLEDALDRVKFISWEDINKRAIASGKFPHWPSVELGDTEYDKMFPYLSRDYGAKILSMVANSKANVIELTDHSDFIRDSLFCEQAYVIDLDRGTFEVYNGFVTDKADCAGRFADLPLWENNGSGSQYYPVTLAALWSLDDLPDYDNFIETLREEDDEDE